MLFNPVAPDGNLATQLHKKKRIVILVAKAVMSDIISVLISKRLRLFTAARMVQDLLT